MANLQVSTVPKASSLTLRSLAVSVLVVGAIFLFLGPRSWAFFATAIQGSQVHAPRLELITQAPLAMQIHLATVLAAFALATIQIVGPKGTRIHRALGWTLTVLFLITAVDSLFIRSPGGGWFNPFQIFSVYTLIAIPLAVFAAHRHNTALHARMMTGFYVGALIIAGVLTFIPGRLMWRVFFG